MATSKCVYVNVLFIYICLKKTAFLPMVGQFFRVLGENFAQKNARKNVRYTQPLVHRNGRLPIRGQEFVEKSFPGCMFACMYVCMYLSMYLLSLG